MIPLVLTPWRIWKQRSGALCNGRSLIIQSQNFKRLCGSLGNSRRDGISRRSSLSWLFWASELGWEWEMARGSQPAPASICIFISPPCPPPHWLAVLGSPHCPQCLRLLLRSWVCQIVPRTEKRWEASLTQPQAPGLPGEEAGKPKSLPDHGSVPKAGKGWVAPAPGVVNPTWLKSQDQNSPKASSL